MLVELSKPEIDLLVEALRKAASRHESEARYNPPAAKPHDVKAKGMNALRVRLTKAITQALAVAAVTLIIATTIAPAFAGQMCTRTSNGWYCCQSNGWGCR